MLKSHLKQDYDNFAPQDPPPPQNIILFELNFNVKCPLLRLLHLLSDLKSTIVNYYNSVISIVEKLYIS